MLGSDAKKGIAKSSAAQQSLRNETEVIDVENPKGADALESLDHFLTVRKERTEGSKIIRSLLSAA